MAICRGQNNDTCGVRKVTRMYHKLAVPVIITTVFRCEGNLSHESRIAQDAPARGGGERLRFYCDISMEVREQDRDACIREYLEEKMPA